MTSSQHAEGDPTRHQDEGGSVAGATPHRTERERRRGRARRALVVGGSLAGLSVAAWLSSAGFEVEIFERSERPLEDRGAGIVLHPSTTRYLVEQAKTPLDRFSVGVRYLRYLDEDGAVASQASSHLRFASYGTIYRHLLASLPDADRYHFGSTVIEVFDDGLHPGVVTADGRRHHGDIVVGADGIRSTVRRQLMPELRLDLASYVAWRGVLPEGDLTGIARTRLADAITYTILDRSHVLTYPIVIPGHDSGRVLRNWVWYRNVGSPDELARLLVDREGRPHELSVGAGLVPPGVVSGLADDARRLLPPILADLVSRTPEPFLQALADLVPPRLVFGRVCLVGDAGFVARPHAAAGTAKACEEARRLAEALVGTEVPAALSRWEPTALDLGRRLVQRSARAGTRAQIDGTWCVGEPLPFGLVEVGDSELP